MSSTEEFRREFVARLVLACDESQTIPPKDQGRQQYICERLQVAPEAVSKWFNAKSMPRPLLMQKLASLLGVDHTWLHYGIKPELDRRERQIHAKGLEGAVHLVWGLIALAGGHCGTLSEKDPRRDYVDFVAMVKGVSYPMRVTLAREIAPDVYEATVAKEFRELRNVLVVQIADGKFHFLDLPSDLVEAKKELKEGNFALRIKRDSKRYTVDGELIPRIVSFTDFSD
ncbi:MAG: helix-turn-helix transcriptional regulator [Chromatiales bacterium]|nr:helix-turn-helix transcriptional regulator [Chromatiales bacterium]